MRTHIPYAKAALATVLFLAATSLPSRAQDARIQEYPVPEGTHPHDVAPAPDGTVWYTGQFSGKLGRLDPETGEVHEVPLGEGSRPHGVIIGPDGAVWVTDGGLNAIVRVDGRTEDVKVYPLPEGSDDANLNTAAFDNGGVLWFTGQEGIYGKLDSKVGKVEVFRAPKGRGPYGITVTPNGGIYYASLAGSYVGHIDPATGSATVLQPPTPDQGSRRVWADSKGRVWSSQWNTGKVAVYDPATKAWKEWTLPGAEPHAYAIYVDENDDVWLTEFVSNAIVRFDPDTEQFEVFTIPTKGAAVRQLLGRPGEVWGAESSTDKIIVIRYGGE